MAEKGFDLLRISTDAAIAGLIALALVGPIMGIKLQGYGFSTDFSLPLIVCGVVFLGRILLVGGAYTGPGRIVLGWFVKSRGRRSVGVAKTGATTGQRFFLFGLIAVALVAPLFLSNYMLSVIILALIYVLLGLGLNIVVGLAGLLDLGYVAFYAVGAYFMALGALYLDLGFWICLPLAAIAAAIVGGLLGFPVLRMHGDYLAIVTLGFGEIIRLILNNWISFTGGPNGVRTPTPTLFGLEFKRHSTGGTTFHEFFGLDYSSAYKYLFIYFVLFTVVCIMTIFVVRLRSMPMGRAWEALREDEIACRSLGINHVTVKLSAFMMGAMTGGIAGVFFASYQGFVSPSSFVFIESALILAIVVLGGMGSTVGVIAAAVILTILPEALREVAEFRILAFGILMVVLMIWKPRGLVPSQSPFLLSHSLKTRGMTKPTVLLVGNLTMRFGGILA